MGCNPAKIIKKRFTNDQINKLKKIKWWDWGKHHIIYNVQLLNSGDIDKFLK